MAASKLTSCVAVTSAAVVSMSAFSDRAYADSYFRLPFFSSKPSNEPSPPNQTSDSKSEPPPPDEPNKSGGFDPESLERGAKALREINSSPYSKQVCVLFLVLTNSVFFVSGRILVFWLFHFCFPAVRFNAKTGGNSPRWIRCWESSLRTYSISRRYCKWYFYIDIKLRYHVCSSWYSLIVSTFALYVVLPNRSN